MVFRHVGDQRRQVGVRVLSIRIHIAVTYKANQSIEQASYPSSNRPTDRNLNQSTNQSSNRPTNHFHCTYSNANKVSKIERTSKTALFIKHLAAENYQNASAKCGARVHKICMIFWTECKSLRTKSPAI